MKTEPRVVEDAPVASNGEVTSEKQRAKWLVPLAAVVLIVGIFLGVRSYLFSQSHESTDDAFVTSHVINVSPQIQGTVVKVFVKDNQEVKAGDLIAQLDDRSLKAAFDQAKANLDVAIAQAKGAGITVNLTGQTGQAQIQQALGNLQQNQATIATSQSEVARSVAGVANSQALLASADAGVSNAQAAYQTSIANASRAKAGIAAAQADLQTANASASAARAAITSATAQASRATKEAQRDQSLVAQGAISSQAAENAQAAADSAGANLDAARQQAGAADAVVSERQVAVQSAREQLTAAQAAVSQAQAQIRAAQAQVSAAKAGVSESQAATRTAQEGVSAAKGRAEQAQGVLSQANTAGAQVDVSKSAQAQAQARVEQAKAALEEAKTNLDYTRIVSPVSGKVSKLTVTVGAVVQPLFPLLSLIPDQSTDPMWITANFKETQLGHMRPGQPAEIEVDGIPGITFKGRLDSYSEGTGATFALLPADNATGNFTKVVQRVPAKVTFNPGQSGLERLVSGMSANVTVTTN